MKTIIMTLFLIQFNFYSNFIDDFPHNKIELSVFGDTLQAVYLVDNGATKFPNYIFKIDSILRLRIYNCNYKNLPLRIRELKVLKELSISLCYNFDFQESFKRLSFNSSLSELKIFDNKLLQIPSNIQNLVNLEELVLSNNNLKSIPKSVFQLRKLKKLNLNDNNIKEFEVGEEFNKSISSLSLNRNGLITLPKGINKLKGLISLSLLENDSLDFENICDVAKDLPNLEILKIYGLQIDSIPQNINNLKKLKFIFFPNCGGRIELIKKFKSILKNTRFI